MGSVGISFRPLAETDLEILCDWLNRPHMRRHYQAEPISLDEVRSKYRPRLADAGSVRCHMALLDGQPLGSLQAYLIRHEKVFADEIGETDGVAIDLFIGEESRIGHGIGRRMLRCYVLEVVKPLFPGENKCFICHGERNTAAVRCSLAAGFEFLRNVIEDSTPSKLLAFAR
jgi:aminoglycoside 6'-N-acetyltransferase